MAWSQIGIRIFHNQNSVPGYSDFFDEVSTVDQVLSSSQEIHLDYWMRLRDTRIEFYPYLSYHQAATDIAGTDFQLRQIGAGINTHIYLFDLIGDCDCPTFSKQGGFFKKGFFFMAGAGVDYSEKGYDGDYADGNLDAVFHGGMGLDIGINDLLTLTPLLQIQYYPDMSGHDLGPQFGRENLNYSTSLTQLQFGLRLGIRLDYDRY